MASTKKSGPAPASRSRTIDLAGRQRMLNQRFVKEVLLGTLGIKANAHITLRLLHDTAKCLAFGGILSTPDGHGEEIPAAPTSELADYFSRQMHLVSELERASAQLLSTPYGGAIQRQQQLEIEALVGLSKHFHEIADQAVQQLSAWAEAQLREAREREDQAVQGMHKLLTTLQSQSQALASTSEQLAATALETAGNAAKADDGVSGARRVAALGDETVTKAAGIMHAVAQSVKEIASFVDATQQIAFQTNLLALNAAVEAAHAGKAGAGFAIVAREVRALAETTSRAATEVRNVVSSAQTRVDSGRTLMTESSESLKSIIASMDQVSQLTGHLASASSQQGQAVQLLNASITKMDALAASYSEASP